MLPKEKSYDLRHEKPYFFLGGGGEVKAACSVSETIEVLRAAKLAIKVFFLDSK